ncbi:MAG: peptide chain release factor N(5)-glutamine methyltransferase [bacterium]
MSESIGSILTWATKTLKDEGIENPQLDAEVILAHVLKIERISLYLDLRKLLEEALELKYKSLIEERLKHKPISYIIGHKEFMSLDFKVNQNVLIPRPETEILVETICKMGISGSMVLELGTGSGAIAVSLAKYNQDWQVVATDISFQALLVAYENAKVHNVSKRVRFIQTNLFDGLSKSKLYDWVVSNPPYIPTSDLDTLPNDIRNYEPIIALDGGRDGLDIIKKILIHSPEVLKANGYLAIEIGCGQSKKIIDFAKALGTYSDCFTVNDYSGIPRVFCCKLRRI